MSKEIKKKLQIHVVELLSKALLRQYIDKINLFRLSAIKRAQHLKFKFKIEMFLVEFFLELGNFLRT